MFASAEDLGSKTRTIKSGFGTMIEMEPHCRLVLMNNSARGRRERKRYWLSLPYTQYYRTGIHGSSFMLTFSTEPASKDTDFYFPLFPDITNHARVQIGCGASGETDLKKLVKLWWSYYMSVSSQYLGCQLLAGTCIKNYRKWEELTNEDPSFIMDVEFTKVDETYIKEMRGWLK